MPHGIEAGRLLRVCLILSLLALAAASAAAEERRSGQWRSFWREGSALMTLAEHADGTVTGTYEPGGGRLRGTIEDRVLRGAWQEPAASGEFVFALSPDGRSFSGRYGDGGFWNGERIDPRAVEAVSTLRATPRDVLRSLLVAGNATVYEGDVHAQRRIEGMLSYEGGVADGRDRTRRRTLLWRLVELSTLRIVDAPLDSETDEARFRIGPAGTSVDYTLRFARDAAGWRLVVED